MVAKRKSWIVLASFLVCLFLLGEITPALSKDTKPTVSASEMKQVVSVNKASLEELEIVRGIGPVLAKRVIDYRTSNGPFKSLEDLAQVSGIGKAKYEKMKEQLSL